MIHYNGTVSKRPGQQACTQRSPQALAETWHATDCTSCKMTLMGMPVAELADSTKSGLVADFDAVSVVIETPADDGESAPDAVRVSWDGFDHRWTVGDV